jgi:competence protein ComEC
MDHIGGLRGALRGREVGVALVSPFKDERWGATDTFELLGRAKVSVLPVERGMSGNLGAIAWQVLGPNRNAAEAEDSNDASVVMLWKALEFNLLTMADVGEKGQMRLARDKAWWGDPDLDAVPLILKVAHHGSADQFGELIEEIDPDLSLISAGKNNSYGHPTQRTLTLLQSTGSAIYRTDQIGAIAVATDGGTLKVANAPG